MLERAEQGRGRACGGCEEGSQGVKERGSGVRENTPGMLSQMSEWTGKSYAEWYGLKVASRVGTCLVVPFRVVGALCMNDTPRAYPEQCLEVLGILFRCVRHHVSRMSVLYRTMMVEIEIGFFPLRSLSSRTNKRSRLITIEMMCSDDGLGKESGVVKA